MFPTTAPRLLPGLLVACLLLASPAAQRDAGAAFIAFTGPPGAADSFTFGANGSLSGTAGITLASVSPPDTGPSFGIANGLLSFAFGSPAGGNAAQGFNFQFGGSLTITGSFNGGPQETILSVTGQLQGGFLANIGGSTYRPSLGTVVFVGTLAADVAAAYGTSRFVVGDLGLTFTGQPGGSVSAGTVAFARFQVVGAAVPEPGSAVLVGMGALLVLVRCTVCNRPMHEGCITPA
jgi:hypothetical protein